MEPIVQCWAGFLFLFVFFQIYSFIAKSDIQRGGETKRKIFHPMIHFPSGAMANAMPGSRNIFWVSHKGAGSQHSGPSSTDFPGHKQGTGWKVELPGLEPAPIWGLGGFNERTLVPRPCHQVQLLLSFSNFGGDFFFLFVLNFLS